MKPDEIQKLLGGYATGTLSDEERRILFEAAMQDQELFDSLSREESLKELIETPGARERLLAAVSPRPEPVLVPWWRRPWPWALAGTAAVAALSLIVVGNLNRRPLPAPPPALEARQEASPVPAPLEKQQQPPPPPAVKRTAPAKRTFNVPAPALDTRQKDQERDALTPLQEPKLADKPAGALPPPPKPAPAAVTPPARPAAVTATKAELAAAKAKDMTVQNFAAAEVTAGARGRADEARMGQAQPAVGQKMAAGPAALRPGATTPEFRYTLQPDQNYEPGQTVQLEVTPNWDGHLYVLRRDDQGPWQKISDIKAKRDAPAGLPVPAGQTARQIELMVILSRDQISDFSEQAVARLERETPAGSGIVGGAFKAKTPQTSSNLRSVLTLKLQAR